MANNRMGRTNSDITAALSSILREVKDPRVQQGMISVTGCDAAKDLSSCKVYLSVLGLQDEREFRRGLKSSNGWIRKELARRLQLRNTPELLFQLDHSIEEGAHINRLINELNIQPAEEAEDGDTQDD